jgi:hypothetical protein
MERRQFLALVGASALSGCLGTLPAPAPTTDDGASAVSPKGASTPAASGDTPRQTAGEPTPESGRTLAELGIPPTVCEESIRTEFSIRAIVDPVTAPEWAGHEIPDRYETDETGGLPEGNVVVGIEAGEVSRAYPFDVLYHHEIVNDSVGSGGPALVTYCSLCRSGMVARRTVDGEVTTFEVSGLLWRPPDVRAENSALQNRTEGFTRSEADVGVRPAGNLVMYDHATHSYWSQILARAICGPKRATQLEILPSTVTTWREWRTAHPGTDVLLPPPHSETA